MCFSLQRRAIFQHRNFKKWSEHVARGAFWLKMCFSLQRRTIFEHRNFKKWSENVVFCTFWLWNVLLATAACNFSTSQLPKVVRTCSERRIFIENVLLATAACHFSCLLCRTRRFSEVTFRPSRHTKHWKAQHFATSLTFRACWSSFFPHLLIFFLAARLFQLSILSEVRLLNFLWLYRILSCFDIISSYIILYQHIIWYCIIIYNINSYRLYHIMACHVMSLFCYFTLYSYIHHLT